MGIECYCTFEARAADITQKSHPILKVSSDFKSMESIPEPIADLMMENDGTTLHECMIGEDEGIQDWEYYRKLQKARTVRSKLWIIRVSDSNQLIQQTLPSNLNAGRIRPWRLKRGENNCGGFKKTLLAEQAFSQLNSTSW